MADMAGGQYRGGAGLGNPHLPRSDEADREAHARGIPGPSRNGRGGAAATVFALMSRPDGRAENRRVGLELA
jgi:hypothetical protein